MKVRKRCWQNYTSIISVIYKLIFHCYNYSTDLLLSYWYHISLSIQSPKHNHSHFRNLSAYTHYILISEWSLDQYFCYRLIRAHFVYLVSELSDLKALRSNHNIIPQASSSRDSTDEKCVHKIDSLRSQFNNCLRCIRHCSVVSYTSFLAADHRRWLCAGHEIT